MNMIWAHARLAILFVAALVAAVGTPFGGLAAETVSVAILEPEVTGELRDDERQVIAATVDAVIANRIAEIPDVAMVDRQQLDAVLAEHDLATAGASKGLALDAGSPLRPFWSAGLLVVTEVDVTNRLAIVEVVSAQRGTRQCGVTAHCDETSAPAIAAAIDARLPALCADLKRSLTRASKRPVVEVAMDLPAGLERARWLCEDAAVVARSRVAAAGDVTLLVPRKPLVTKEERLLRVMGLADPQPGDTAARLRASPDVTVRVNVTEKSGVGKTFSETPITLGIEVTGIGMRPKREAFYGTAGTWPDVAAAMSEWLDGVLRTLGEGGRTDAAADDERARELARREMASIERFAKLSDWEFRDLPVHLRVRLHEVAARAVHLDPMNEPAAHMAMLTVMAEHTATQWEDRPEAYFRAVLTEGQRYRERFGDRVPKHHKDALDQVIRAGIILARRLDSPHRRCAQREGLRGPPQKLQYELAKLYVPAMAEVGLRGLTDKVYGTTNDLFLFGHFLVGYLIPNIPEERLDHEHATWRTFYETRIAPLPPEERYRRQGVETMVPWEMVDAVFAARKRDPKAVRRSLQAVAGIYPEDVEHIWGGTEYSKPLVPVLLEAAGDPEWQSWEPLFGKPVDVRVSLDEMTVFMIDLMPKATGPWADVPTTEMPGTVLRVPEQVRDAAFIEGHTFSRGVKAVLQVDDDIWLTLAPGDLKEPLSVGRMAGHDGGFADLATEHVPWPEKDRLPGRPDVTCAHAMRHGDRQIVFMGTRQHGLLRFDNVDGKWAGRWLTTRSGLPANGVRRLASCRKGAVTELLVIGGDREEGRMDADVSMVWSVNLDTDAVTLIHDGHPHERQIHVPVAVLRDGTKMLLELAGSAAYRDLPSIPDIVSIERGTTYSLPLVAMPFTAAGRPGEVGRIWCPSWDGYRHSLDSFDADTLARCADGAPGAGPGNSGFPAVSDQVRGVLGEIMARPSGGSYGTARIGDWPCMGMPFATGTANVIWLGLNTGGGWNQSRMIVGYRPAPRGTDDWAADDLWIGPFHTPGKELILDLAPAQEPGRYLLSTTGHVMLLDEATILDEATRIGAIRSTRQWRGQYRKRLARAGWRSVVPALLVDERFDDALAVLKAEREKLDRDQGPAERRQVFDFWTARVLADMPGRADDAIAAYDAIASDKDVSGAAEAFARANQVILLHREEHWQALLDVATAFKKRFPQTATRDSLQWYIDEAGQHVRGEPDTGDETSQDAHP